MPSPRTIGKRMWAAAACGAVAASLVAGACASRPTPAPVAAAPAAPTTAPATRPAAGPLRMPTLADAAPADFPGLHNVVAYADGVLSGSVPEGHEGFESLRRLGIKSVITVDGSEPELEAAKAVGLRYVHLPVTYAGFSEQRKLEIARAVRDLPKPLYLHCHHGKHRSAAALGSAVVTLGGLTPDEALARMRVSGTAPEYKGLYACTAGSAAVLPAVLDAVSKDFPEVTRPEGTVKSMVEIDVAMENLKAVQKAGWRAPADHPDLSAAAEAGRVADLQRYLLAHAETKKHPAKYAELMKASSEAAGTLEALIAIQGKATPADADKQFNALQQSCKACHAAYRD